MMRVDELSFVGSRGYQLRNTYIHMRRRTSSVFKNWERHHRISVKRNRKIVRILLGSDRTKHLDLCCNSKAVSNSNNPAFLSELTQARGKSLFVKLLSSCPCLDRRMQDGNKGHSHAD